MWTRLLRLGTDFLQLIPLCRGNYSCEDAAVLRVGIQLLPGEKKYPKQSRQLACASFYTIWQIDRISIIATFISSSHSGAKSTSCSVVSRTVSKSSVSYFQVNKFQVQNLEFPTLWMVRIAHYLLDMKQECEASADLGRAIDLYFPVILRASRVFASFVSGIYRCSNRIGFHLLQRK